MHADELLEHVKKTVRTFENVELVGPGRGFHYTPYADAIEKHGRFLGAPIDENLDQTQAGEFGAHSPPATHDPGVVFAYNDIESAEE
jgi:hypothetical protein